MSLRACLFILFMLLRADFSSAEYRVGIITDLSKRVAYIGRQTSRGAALAADEIRGRGGSLGILVEDHAMEPSKAALAAQKLLNTDKVDALFVDASGPAGAVAPIAVAADRVMIYDAIARSIKERCPVCFKTFLNAEEACRVIALAWRGAGFEKIGLLHTVSEYGDLCAEGAKTVYAALLDEQYNLGEDFSSQVLRLKSKGARGVLNVAYEADVLNMLKVTRNLNFEPRFGVIEGNVTEQVRAQYPAELKRIDAYNAVTPSAAFLELYRRTYPQESLAAIEHAVMAYLHIGQLYEALASCETPAGGCVAARLAAAPPAREFDFEGWQDRVAQFKGRLKPISSQ